MKWEETTLGEFVTLRRGYDLPDHQRKPGDIPIIGSFGITGYHNQAKVKAPGVTLGRSGAIGIANYSSVDYWPLNTALYVTEFHGNDERFAYYFLKNMNFKSYNSGGTQPSLNRNAIYPIKIKIPPLSTQKRIADILSTYDDLIDNNNRRIALLEESVHLLYREWFVSLRFPGHESVRVVDGVPSGWELRPLGTICQVIMGQSPKSEFYNTNQQGLPFHQGVKFFGNRFVEHETYCTNSTRIAEAEDILCSVRAPVGRLNITLDKIVIGRGLSAIRNLFGDQSFQFYQLQSYFFKEDLIGSGTIFASVTKKQLLA